jgi:hypothetical protein
MLDLRKILTYFYWIKCILMYVSSWKLSAYVLLKEMYLNLNHICSTDLLLFNFPQKSFCSCPPTRFVAVFFIELVSLLHLSFWKSVWCRLAALSTLGISPFRKKHVLLIEILILEQVCLRWSSKHFWQKNHVKSADLHPRQGNLLQRNIFPGLNKTSLYNTK